MSKYLLRSALISRFAFSSSPISSRANMLANSVSAFSKASGVAELAFTFIALWH
ncbi:hypothetical protein [Colwellia ponticola]|uniref:hypothetical protein n=1 Tax=Colwellia ponticola TaxID=2304625 RepID=UPI001486C65B|nr:hypothetical protein [Colwellia ponticola]